MSTAAWPDSEEILTHAGAAWSVASPGMVTVELPLVGHTLKAVCVGNVQLEEFAGWIGFQTSVPKHELMRTSKQP